MPKPRKLIALCGADLHQQNMPALLEAFGCDFHVLALDSLAYNIASKCGYPVALLDDWIDPPTMRSLAVAAATMERLWFLPAKQLFEQHDGICWPLLDHQAMHWFWRDTVLATAFTCLFREAGGSEIKLLGPISPTPTVYYDSSQPWKLLLHAFAQAADEIFGRYGDNFKLLLDTWVKSGTGEKRTRRLRRTSSGSDLNYHNRLRTFDSQLKSAKPGKVIFAFNAGEEQRFTPMIRHLSARHLDVEVFTLFSDIQTAETLSVKWGIPVTCFPSPHDLDARLQALLKTAFHSVLENSADFPLRLILDLFGFHFDYYCAKRWPGLSATLETWASKWEETEPSCVITSQLVDAESQLPAEAANRLGIPTFALPHGGMYLGDEAQVSRYNLYSFQTHKCHLMAGGLAETNVLACRDAVARNEYLMDCSDQQPIGINPFFRILVICCSATLDKKLMPLVNIQAQIDAIKSLKEPPPDIVGRVEVIFKVHPGWPDLETFRAAGIDLERDILPVNSDLHALLPSFDLVIDLNLSGSAIIHVIRAGKPLIFHWPSRINVGHWYEEIFLRAGVLTETSEELWQKVGRFLSDDMYANRLTKKAKDFADEYLDDKDYPDLADILKQLPNLPEQHHKVLKDDDTTRCASLERGSRMEITNIDADPSFYYGEIPEAHLNRIFADNETLHDIEAATHKYCNETNNEYFREYALDPRRALYLGLCGSVAGLRVLDYGCGLGSLGIPAARAGATVTFVDSCLARLRFASTRCQQSGLTETSFYGCKTWQSLPFTPGSFDLIVLNGILEWIPKTIGATFETVLDAQLSFLKVMAGLLKPDGRIFLAIENRFALQYLMGYPEDHTDIKYLSIMPRKEANDLHRQTAGSDFVTWTWGYDDYRRLLPQVGLYAAEGYGMFPDYRFPQLIAPLQDTAALKRGMLIETYDAPLDERRRYIDYLAEMGQLHQAVYSFGFMLRKAEI